MRARSSIDIRHDTILSSGIFLSVLPSEENGLDTLGYLRCGGYNWSVTLR
jgi:hypothetical protein